MRIWVAEAKTPKADKKTKPEATDPQSQVDLIAIEMAQDDLIIQKCLQRLSISKMKDEELAIRRIEADRSAVSGAVH